MCSQSNELYLQKEDAKNVFIALGTNLGARFENISKALNLLKETVLEDPKSSVIFETKALLPKGAPSSWDIPYFNLVVQGKTKHSPQNLLQKLKSIELFLGRTDQEKKWAPRTIDLDILAYDNTVLSQNNLTIPHQELYNRPFLIKLMAQLQADWKTPDTNSKYFNLSLDEIIHKKITSNSDTIKSFSPFPLMVGIVNITPDSFSDGNKYFDAENAFAKIEGLIADGAAIIDIGAQSTKRGAKAVTKTEEWQRLKPLLEILSVEFAKKAAKPLISIDSFYPEIFQKAMSIYPIDWINNLKANLDESLIEIALNTKCKIVLTHTLGIPPTNDLVLPFNSPPIDHVLSWAKKQLLKLESYGISKHQIILDPGIGFGKSKFQSLSLLQNIAALKTLGCEILAGHSRKLKIVSQEKAHDRDLETLGVSQALFENNIHYIRAHNVKLHHELFSAKILTQQGLKY